MALVEKGGKVVIKVKKDRKAAKVDKVVVEVDGELKGVEENGEEIVEKKAKREKKKAQKQAEEEENKKKEGVKNDEGTTPSKKRKRTLPEGELAIDVTLPEPPSKKALRKLKKTAATTTTTTTTTSVSATTPQTHGIGATQNRSKYGVWIGNLTFTTAEPQLREFFTSPGSTGEADSRREVPPPPGMEVGRINLPTKKAWNKISRKEELQNRGFAYVDFNIPEGVSWAVKYKSELYLGSRKVLIKDATNFDGRPMKSEAVGVSTGADGTMNGGGGAGGAVAASRNPPSKILFVGNLPFETTDEEISEHFSFAGVIQKVRLARFEDSGKCKGFGFLDFNTIEEVDRAMKGVSLDDRPMPGEDGVPVEGKEEVMLQRERKKLRGDRRYFKGRLIRMEFGEDAEVRYKKRWGGKGKKGGEGDGEGEGGQQKRRRVGGEGGEGRSGRGEEQKTPRKKEGRVYGKGKDKAMVDRMVGTAVQAMGKKVTFD